MSLSHFMVGLRFPLGQYLLKILSFYDVPLCRYSPTSIGAMTGFLSLLCSKGLPFLLDVFRYFF